tara:strand:+ start:181 stop:393 length:213 start_codon:yes stop_codon:yes gene_type:complete
LVCSSQIIVFGADFSAGAIKPLCERIASDYQVTVNEVAMTVQKYGIVADAVLLSRIRQLTPNRTPPIPTS